MILRYYRSSRDVGGYSEVTFRLWNVSFCCEELAGEIKEMVFVTWGDELVNDGIEFYGNKIKFCPFCAARIERIVTVMGKLKKSDPAD